MNNRSFIKKAIGVTTAAAMFLPATSGLNFTANAQSGIDKSESVYVNTNSTGAIENETVSNWLHSDKSGVSVTDIANLTGIKNISGKQKPFINGNNVTWNFSGKDLYYSGTTSKSLPISMKVEYYLDGSPITPGDLGGKSGNVEIKISFKNLDAHNETINGKTMQIYTPFLCMAAVNLPKKHFSNVTVNVGDVQDDGVNQLLCFVNVPGLKDNFGMIKDKIDLADELDIQADVKDFELGPIMAMAMPATNLDSLKSSSDINNTFSNLDKLYDGGSKLKSATGALSSGESQFASGIQQLYEGVTEANSSYSQLQSGAQQLKEGADNPGGIKLLQSSLGQLSSGAKSLSGGTAELYNAVANNPDINEAMKGLSDLSKVSQLNDGAQQVAAGLAQLNAQLSSASSSLTAYQQEIAALNKGAGSISDALSQMYGLHSYMPSIDSLGKQAPELASGTKSYVDTTNSLIYALRSNQKLFTDVATELAQSPSDQALQTELAFLYDGSAQEEAVLSQMHIGASTITAKQDEFKAGGDKIVAGTKSIGDNFPALASSLDNIDSNMPELINGSKQLYSGTQELNKQINPSGSTNESDYTLYDKIVALKAGVGKLSDGAYEVASGTSQLNTAVANSNLSGLSNSVSQLKTGIGTINTGAGKLSAGLSKVSAGDGSLTTLQDGIDELFNGVDAFQSKGLLPLMGGTSQLNSASGKLLSGASQLNSGMNKFFDEGISKCKSPDVNDINDALKVKDASINLADEYKTFSGAGDGISSSVKFILKTDEIKAPVAQVHNAKAAPKINKNIFEKIADWFKSVF